MTPRCELSDLLRGQCAHCRGSELVAGYRLQIDQLDGLAGRLWRLRVWDTPAAVVLEASSACSHCGVRLHAGTYAFRVPEGLHCEECVR